MKEDLKKQAAQSKESQQALAARDALIDILLDKGEIVLPESAVDHQVEHRVGDVEIIFVLTHALVHDGRASIA